MSAHETASVDLDGAPTAQWAPRAFIAAGLSAALAVRVLGPGGVPIGFVLALILLPVTLAALSNYRGATTIAVLAVLSVVSGVVLTYFAPIGSESDVRLMVALSIRVLGFAVGLAGLLWARQQIGTRMTTLAFGVGGLMSVAIRDINLDNPWKFNLSVPVTLIVLTLPWVYGRRRWEFGLLISLGAISAVNDSRSAAAMMLIAAALVMTQGAGRTTNRPKSTGFIVLGRIILIGVGGFYMVQAAILDGMLGEAAQARTAEQIELSGSVLVGGRPELGATAALVTERPWGYGSGALATASDVLTAKTGMAATGYDPNNGYVERYMFGRGFEVHSVLGNLWIQFGVIGLILGVVLMICIATGLVHAMQRQVASGVLLFLGLRSLWDLAFSPLASSIWTFLLALAVVLPLAARPGVTSVRRRPQDA